MALKVITKSLLDPADLDYIISRFRHEAEAVGRLTHPRIAAIYDFIETEDIACIVMELVNGKSLAHHLKEVTQYGFKDTWEIIRQVLDGQMDYLFTAKEETHRYLYEEIASLEKLGEVKSLERTHWDGKVHKTWRYRWANGVRFRNEDTSVNVNWVEAILADEAG